MTFDILPEYRYEIALSINVILDQKSVSKEYADAANISAKCFNNDEEKVCQSPDEIPQSNEHLKQASNPFAYSVFFDHGTKVSSSIVRELGRLDVASTGFAVGT